VRQRSPQVLYKNLHLSPGVNTVGGGTQDHLVKAALEHCDYSCCGLHLRVGDRALLARRASYGCIVIGRATAAAPRLR
jgi:hypothetical protein